MVLVIFGEPHTTMLSGSLPDSHVLTCGVPQGTILDPLLFLLDINDLSNFLSNCEPRIYADDAHAATVDFLSRLSK